jgi:DNA transformation protein
MPLSPGFIEFALEQLDGFGPVQVKKMFGGATVARDGVGFGILDDDIFFIKADVAFGAELKAQGCKPWSYSVRKDGTVRDIAYWSLPDSAADDPDETSALARRSFDIALKASAEKALKTRKPAAKSASAAGKTAPGKAAKKAPAAKKTASAPANKK